MSATIDVTKDADGNTVSTPADRPITEGAGDSYDPMASTANPTPTDDTTLDLNKPLVAPPISMKRKKQLDKQRKQLGKAIVQMRRKYQKDQGRINRQLKALEEQIGSDDFEAIKAMVTVFHPEKKDEKGNVVQQAHNAVNYKALMVEAKNFIVLRRERRMKTVVKEDGTIVGRTRKRTSGRRSNRKVHKAAYDRIIERGKKAVENKEEISTLKV